MLQVQGGPRELRAAVLAMKAADRTVRRDIWRLQRQTMAPEWSRAVATRLAGYRPQTVTLTNKVSVKAGNPPVLQAATSRRKHGRLVPAEAWPWFEYGTANREAYSTYQRRSPGGGSHMVRRRASRQIPARRRKGRTLGPALANILPRMAALTVQSVVRAYADALEKR